MRDKNNEIHIAVLMKNSMASFYSVTIHEEDIFGLVSTEEYELLQHESHVNQKDLRAYIDTDGIRKIGAFDNTQPSQYHFWNEIKADWDITPEKYAELESIENARALQEKKDAYYSIENTISRLERIRDRDDSEQAELDELIDESTKLFREIRAEKEKLNDRNA